MNLHIRTIIKNCRYEKQTGIFYSGVGIVYASYNLHNRVYN